MGALKAHAMTHVLANGVGDVDPAESRSLGGELSG